MNRLFKTILLVSCISLYVSEISGSVIKGEFKHGKLKNANYNDKKEKI